MSDENERAILESLLFVAGDEGLSLTQICSAMDIQEDAAKSLIKELQAAYQDDVNRGIKLVALAGTYQLATKREFADYLKKLADTPTPSSLSQAGLETLAIIAYKQPITRIEIEEIRGVKTERAIHTLIARGLIKEAGRAEGTGRPKLYGTTKEFLDYFGLHHIEDLPDISADQEDEEGQNEADLFFSKFNDSTI